MPYQCYVTLRPYAFPENFQRLGMLMLSNSKPGPESVSLKIQIDAEPQKSVFIFLHC